MASAADAPATSCLPGWPLGLLDGLERRHGATPTVSPSLPCLSPPLFPPPSSPERARRRRPLTPRSTPLPRLPEAPLAPPHRPEAPHRRTRRQELRNVLLAVVFNLRHRRSPPPVRRRPTVPELTSTPSATAVSSRFEPPSPRARLGLVAAAPFAHRRSPPPANSPPWL